jgi:hypothetical protein
VINYDSDKISPLSIVERTRNSLSEIVRQERDYLAERKEDVERSEEKLAKLEYRLAEFNAWLDKHKEAP